jgi:DNA helicase IV
LEISGDPGFKPEEMLQGYRSTRQILDYASHLLEAKHRHPKALRDGPAPLVRKVKKDQLPSAVRSAAIELCVRHPDGKVAVIAVEPADIRQGFLSAGWRKTAARYTFSDDNGREVAVYKPVMARGLEFDGVVVVEPVDFPENLGKNGRLYTALTRPNKELTVVHSKPLPKAIKGKGRKAD